jgi:hypothetical protein
MNPVLAACQLVNVSKPGEEPGLWDAPEDCRLMLPKAVVRILDVVGSVGGKATPVASYFFPKKLKKCYKN